MAEIHISTSIAASPSTYTGGSGRVRGTVRIGPTPASRRVRLLSVLDARLYGETWSDAVTGEYSFDYVDETRKYFVVAHDHSGAYNAVIADQVTPEPMS